MREEGKAPVDMIPGKHFSSSTVLTSRKICGPENLFLIENQSI